MSLALLHVVAAEDVTPHMRRITFGGEDLARFASVAPDQQVKLFFARDGGVPRVPEAPEDGDVGRWHARYLAIPEPERPWMRTYSIRRHLADRRRIEVDFALHGEGGGEGPASRWAYAAREGDAVGLLGPARSHYKTPPEGAWKLFVGDETALPAMAATVEALEPGERALVCAEVEDAREEQRWETRGEVEYRWVHRNGGPRGQREPLVTAVRAAPLPEGPVFAWVAGEAGAVRAVRRHLVDERGLDKRAVAFSGYWRRDLTQDDGPTADEAVERQEIMTDMEELAARAEQADSAR
ncbi:siderophore-interacting protein [Streptomyces sp. NPDC048172]|uniref:siderophore-interacting protein n=1 Tax=Streptomyces sp. NPDC048172 TaxID=3365505 RepID=UPI003722F80D